MTETGRAEIHPCSRRGHEILSAGLVRQEAEHQVLQQPARVREGDVDSGCGVRGLLQEDGVAGYFADVDGDGEALAWEEGRGWVLVGRVVDVFGDFCGGRGWYVGGREGLQAKMVFMMGMYWCARSPETDRMRIREFRVGGCTELGSEGARRGSVLVFGALVEWARVCLLM